MVLGDGAGDCNGRGPSTVEEAREFPVVLDTHIDELLSQRAAVAQLDQRRAELRTRIQEYEAKYQLKSRSVHAAIERGELKETQEVCRWIMDYALFKRLKPRQPR